MNRSDQLEWMDDLEYEGEELYQTLRELDIINKWLGGVNISISGLKKLVPDPKNKLKIVDLGCGSGYNTVRMMDHAHFKNTEIEAIGIDANPHVVSFAHEKFGQRMKFLPLDVLKDELPEADIYHCSLFLHHFSFEQIEQLITKMMHKARIGIIINDLHRHIVAYYAIKLITKLFSKSPMVQYDAPISVKRGFLKSEIMKIMPSSSRNHLSWKWAFRWLVTIGH